MKLVLASGSPRRREILENLGFEFEIITTDAEDEIETDGMPPDKVVCMLAEAKGKAVLKMLSAEDDRLVVAADTVVTFDGKILGKPKDREEAKKMLKSLSGRNHLVMTGLYIGSNGKGTANVSAKTEVYFKNLSNELIEAYLDTEEYADKAGAYGIQGKGAVLVENIVGDYFNIVGFPVNKFYEILTEKFGVNMPGGGGTQ